MNDSTKFYPLKGVTSCPPETREIEIQIKFTAGAVCNNISLYIGRPTKSETDYDEIFGNMIDAMYKETTD